MSGALFSKVFGGAVSLLTKPFGLVRHNNGEMGTWDGITFTYYRLVDHRWTLYGGTNCPPNAEVYRSAQGTSHGK